MFAGRGELRDRVACAGDLDVDARVFERDQHVAHRAPFEVGDGPAASVPLEVDRLGLGIRELVCRDRLVGGLGAPSSAGSGMMPRWRSEAPAIVENAGAAAIPPYLLPLVGSSTITAIASTGSSTGTNPTNELTRASP